MDKLIEEGKRKGKSYRPCHDKNASRQVRLLFLGGAICKRILQVGEKLKHTRSLEKLMTKYKENLNYYATLPF
jgi:hypothetical protein